MKYGVVATAKLTNRSDILNDADFVIHEHNRNQDSIGTQGSLEHFKINETVFLNIQIGHLKTLTLQLTTRIQNSFVLCFDRNDVLAALGIEIRSAFDSQVI